MYSHVEKGRNSLLYNLKEDACKIALSSRNAIAESGNNPKAK